MESNLDLLQNNVEKHREAVAVPQTTVQNDNSVFIGEALNDDEKLNLLMTDTKPYITILVGFEGYGKTSFVATCYHIMLTDGGNGEYKFCDSDTLVSLERRSFLRRFNAAWKVYHHLPNVQSVVRHIYLHFIFPKMDLRKSQYSQIIREKTTVHMQTIKMKSRMMC